MKWPDIYTDASANIKSCIGTPDMRSYIGRKKRRGEKEKSFGIYWEGDNTFDLKVPRVGDI